MIKKNTNVDTSVSEKLVKDILAQVLPEVAKQIDENLKQLNQPKNDLSVVGLGGDSKKSLIAKPKKGNSVARCLRYLYAAKGDSDRAINMAMDHDKDFGDIWEGGRDIQLARQKAMGQDTLTTGGSLLPPQFSLDIIEELGAKAVVRSLGVTALPMNGSLSMPYIDTASTAYYVGEASNATESTPTTGQLQLSEKTLVALGVLSNQLLANGGPRVESAITNQLIRTLKRKEDYTFIRALGTENSPKGMLYWAASANKFDANGTVNVANVTVDLGKAINKLMAADVDMDGGCGWIFSSRTYQYLTTARDGNSNLVWADEMNGKGTLLGYPFKVTSQIPENLGGATNESEVYFASFKDLIIGESEMMEVSIHPDGAYHDGSSVVSGISTNQTPIRIVSRHDFGAQYRGAEVAVIRAVKWGA